MNEEYGDAHKIISFYCFLLLATDTHGPTQTMDTDLLADMWSSKLKAQSSKQKTAARGSRVKYNSCASTGHETLVVSKLIGQKCRSLRDIKHKATNYY